MPWWVLVGVGFVLGSIPFGVFVARARGVDVQKAGSGNIGATNVARTVGKSWGALVMFLDAAKGYAPVAWTLALGVPAAVSAGTAGAAVAGHVFCPWLRFRGGKGVATMVGVFLALSPAATLGAAATWIAVYATTKISSAASLTAVTVLAASVWLLGAPPAHGILAALGWALVLFRHRGNLVRLIRGEEKQV